MNHPTVSPAMLEAATFAAWLRMRGDVRAILAGSRRPEHSHDLPHVAAYLAAHARYRAELHVGGDSADVRRRAHQIRIDAEARYVEAILPEELERITAAATDQL